MLLRTSSAPLLGALNSSFSPAESCKDSLEPPSNVYSPSSFHPLSPPPPSSPTRIPHGIGSGDDTHPHHTHAGLGNDHELALVLRPPRLSRAQSEGDLACSSVVMAATGYANQGMPGHENSLHSERSRRLLATPSHSAILEEIDESRSLPSPRPHCNGSLLSRAASHGGDTLGHDQKFVLNDGEIYTSLKLTPAGSPLACNNKGCRPLTDSECKQLGFLDMASGVGSGLYEWNEGDSGIVSDVPASREAYYQSLLQSDPENPLLLRNYAEYLTKKGEVKKAEEYYERAILADPNDGGVLSSYAKLQWDVNRDQDRAEAYYDQAVQAAPDDCYVMASYASFLWDVDENETSCAAPPVPSHSGSQCSSPPLLASA